MPKRKLPPNEELIAMYASGMSTGEIAEQCGVKPVTVTSTFHRMGYQLRSASEAALLAFERGRKTPTRYWTGKKQPREMVERRISKIRGKNHYLWGGGLHRRGYRKMVEKKTCEMCSATNNLGIHHKNFDHYDNSLENLQILCVSCHMSLHKQAYWDAIHAGQEPPKSNGPVGWSEEKENDGEAANG